MGLVSVGVRGVGWWPRGRENNGAADYPSGRRNSPGSLRKGGSSGENIVHNQASLPADLFPVAGPNPHGTPDTPGTLTPAESLLAGGTISLLRAKYGPEAISDQVFARCGQPLIFQETPGLLKGVKTRVTGQHASSLHAAEQNVYGAETPASEGPAAAGNRNNAKPWLVTNGQPNRVSEARRQHLSQSPLAEALERQQGLRKFIPIGPRGHHAQLYSAIDIDERWRFLFGPEGFPAKLTHPLGTMPAQDGVFHAAADAINGNQECNQLHQCRLQVGDQAPKQAPVLSASSGS